MLAHAHAGETRPEMPGGAGDKWRMKIEELNELRMKTENSGAEGARSKKKIKSCTMDFSDT